MAYETNHKFDAKTYKKDKEFLSDAKGYYQILGLEAGASFDDIKQAYRKKAKELHPDYNKAPDAELRFNLLKTANDILSDNLLRNIYNIKSLSEYVTSVNRKFLLDYKLCGFCGCLTLQPRVIKNEKSASISCPQCAEKLKNWQINDVKSKNILLEQMLVYVTSDQMEKAVITAKQALFFATEELEKESLNNIILELMPNGDIAYQNEWIEPFKLNLKITKKHLIIFFIALLGLKAVFLITDTARKVYLPSLKKAKLKQDNIIGQNVLSIPVDVKDETMIYHLKNNAKIFHGPASEYDLLRTLEKDTTIRLTGVVLNSSFVRIMMPDGIIGFVDSRYLKKGFGKKALPLDNVILDTTPIVSEGK